jgi:hypothetical protein
MKLVKNLTFLISFIFGFYSCLFVEAFNLNDPIITFFCLLFAFVFAIMVMSFTTLVSRIWSYMHSR